MASTHFGSVFLIWGSSGGCLQFPFHGAVYQKDCAWALRAKWQIEAAECSKDSPTISSAITDLDVSDHAKSTSVEGFEQHKRFRATANEADIVLDIKVTRLMLEGHIEVLTDVT